MRNLATAVTTALTCLLTGAAVAGCGGDGSADERSAEEMLDDANDAMSELKSVTIEFTSNPAKGGSVTTRLVTDLDDRCRSKMSWSAGGSLEQIRIGDTDYVRPDRVYLQRWSGRKSVSSAQKLWTKSPVDEAKDREQGLVSCKWAFDSFGKATKGGTTSIDGRDAVALSVTDKADKDGTFTFYVATEGKPYLLRAVYKGAKYRTSTSFHDFDEPLDVRAPKPAEVLDTTGLTD
ncbi:hypothetical protein [Streptomyces sp. TLI_185]|uniref:hypothetical protein n=1 Tax=Streptomyces sp. TLI_185 TaxID=2485151 RepID=UPI000F4DD93E|nr:hypothetical protein [Streptomyces sp. TLI_185]RPF38969.1 hypothetical protein EDD92_9145 [Streptomyces sp. TLI_185]